MIDDLVRGRGHDVDGASNAVPTKSLAQTVTLCAGEIDQRAIVKVTERTAQTVVEAYLVGVGFVVSRKHRVHVDRSDLVQVERDRVECTDGGHTC